MTRHITYLVVKEHVQRTHGQSQREVELRVGGGVEENGDNCTWTTINYFPTLNVTVLDKTM